MKWTPLIGSACFLIALVGCSSGGPTQPPTVDVRGKVLLANGSALTGGILVLQPTEGAFGASAPIQNDGTFVMNDANGRPSVSPGKYQVYVQFKNPSHKSLSAMVHPRYQDSEEGNSDQHVTIQQATRDLTIRLKK